MQDYFPSGQRLPDRLQATRLIRERLSSDGVLPQGCLRIEIDQSWRRSLGHGVRWDDDARLILSRDPELQSERGEALRLLLYLFGRDEAVRLLRAG